jgi:hypothetical protein
MVIGTAAQEPPGYHSSKSAGLRVGAHDLVCNCGQGATARQRWTGKQTAAKVGVLPGTAVVFWAAMNGSIPVNSSI